MAGGAPSHLSLTLLSSRGSRTHERSLHRHAGLFKAARCLRGLLCCSPQPCGVDRPCSHCGPQPQQDHGAAGPPETQPPAAGRPKGFLPQLSKGKEAELRSVAETSGDRLKETLKPPREGKMPLKNGCCRHGVSYPKHGWRQGRWTASSPLPSLLPDNGPDLLVLSNPGNLEQLRGVNKR